MWLLRSATHSIQLGPEGVPFQALHVSILDRSKSFRDCCKLLRNSLSDIDAAFDSGEAALAAELKAVGFHYISRILPGGLGSRAALIDDLLAVLSLLKCSARDIADSGVDAFEQRIFRFRDYFVDLSWVGTIVGNLVLAKGMVQALLLINNKSLRICRKLHNSRKCCRGRGTSSASSISASGLRIVHLLVVLQFSRLERRLKDMPSPRVQYSYLFKATQWRINKLNNERLPEADQRYDPEAESDA
ncbi:hypothetical protein EDD18DRAFT_1109563 [Armillaria luteobubalina]|uniref:Uncharacterized protein n=1 Tax=Armillaria luteobubalina TaxID=153913 RepID=A0AA39UPJ1_9AGAR|nr:hypothetical protein EDD18DRAFT_1109563 [Armillaria luteobubalina]